MYLPKKYSLDKTTNGHTHTNLASHTTTVHTVLQRQTQIIWEIVI